MLPLLLHESVERESVVQEEESQQEEELQKESERQESGNRLKKLATEQDAQSKKQMWRTVACDYVVRALTKQTWK